MESSETIGSAEETHDFAVEEGEPFGGDPNCPHEAESRLGEGHDWDEELQAYRVSYVLKCDTCGAERVQHTDEEVTR